MTDNKREGFQAALAIAVSTLGTYTIDDIIKLLTAAFLALQIAHRVWLWRRDARLSRLSAAETEHAQNTEGSSHD